MYAQIHPYNSTPVAVSCSVIFSLENGFSDYFSDSVGEVSVIHLGLCPGWFFLYNVVSSFDFTLVSTG